MRATFAENRSACIRCDACDGRGSSTSRIVVWDIANADGVVDKRLAGAMYQGIRDYHANTLTFEACPSCLSKIARVCDVCGAAKELDRDHCHECARAFAVADRQETMMAKTVEQIREALAAQDQKYAETLRQIAELREHRGVSAAEMLCRDLPADVRLRYGFDDAHNIHRVNEDSPVWATIRQQEELQRIAETLKASMSRPDSAADQIARAKHILESAGIDIGAVNTAAPPAVEAPKETAMTTPPKTAPDLRNELNTAAWRAGIEIATEEGRDLLVALLTDGMSDDEAAVARPLFAKAFAGRFGVPIVSGAIGGVLHAVQSAGVEIPFVTPATAARIGEEMRVLSASGMMKVVYRSGRDLLAKHGGKMIDAITNLGKIAERTGVRVESEHPAMEDAAWPTDAAKIARSNGAAS